MVKTLEKTAAILEALEESYVATPTLLSNQLEIPRSTIHHHLAILERYGLVVNEDGKYRLSLRFLDIGEQVRNGMSLYEIAPTEVDELAERVQYPAALYIAEHDAAVALYIAGGDPTIPTTLHAGQRLPLYATAAGKALLCQRPESEVAEFIETAELREFTEETLTDCETLRSDLQTAQERGFAIASEERWTGRSSVAVRIPTSVETRSAALELALPPEEFREADETELASNLQKSSKVIEIKSDYSY